MRELTINKNDSGQRLDKFLSKAVPKLPKSLMYKYIRLKRIKVNGKKGDISLKLCENDKVSLYINDEFFETTADSKVISMNFLKSEKLNGILYEDDNIIAIFKEIGLDVHGSSDSDTLVGRIKRYLYEKGEYNPQNEHSFSPAVCNRLDRNTQGIVLAAKNSEALRIINEKIKNREIHKKYICKVFVMPNADKPEGTAKAYLKKDSSTNTVKISGNPLDGYKEIITKYHVTKQNKETAIAKVELITGRTHQIRAHMAYLGYPLVGDNKYGSLSLNKKHNVFMQQLCAYSIEFDFTDENPLSYLNGKTISVDLSEISFLK